MTGNPHPTTRPPRWTVAHSVLSAAVFTLIGCGSSGTPRPSDAPTPGPAVDVPTPDTITLGRAAIDALEFEVPKTSALRDYLGAIEVPGKILLLTEGRKENVYLSARNLTHVEVRPFGEESVYDILWATSVIIERGALENAEAPEAAKEKEEVADA